MASRGGCHGADGPRAPGIATACHNASCRRVVNPSSHAQGPNTTPGPAGGWTQMLDVRIRTLCFKAACTTSFSFHHKSQQESFPPAEGGSPPVGREFRRLGVPAPSLRRLGLRMVPSRFPRRFWPRGTPRGGPGALRCHAAWKHVQPCRAPWRNEAAPAGRCRERRVTFPFPF